MLYRCYLLSLAVLSFYSSEGQLELVLKYFFPYFLSVFLSFLGKLVLCFSYGGMAVQIVVCLKECGNTLL